MVGAFIGIAIGIGAILLGAKGFKSEGLPLTNSKRITGTPAMIAGVVCFLIGLIFIAGSIYPFLRGR